MPKLPSANKYLLLTTAIFLIGLFTLWILNAKYPASPMPQISNSAQRSEQARLDEVESLIARGKIVEASTLLSNAPPNPSNWNRWRCIQQEIVGLTGDAWQFAQSALADDCLVEVSISPAAATSRPEETESYAKLQELYEDTVVDPVKALPNLIEFHQTVTEEDPLIKDMIVAIQSALAAGSPAFVYAQAGQTFARHGHWDLAVSSFETAVKMEPDYVEALAYLGLARDRAGGEGFEELSDAIHISPAAPLPHLFLGMHWKSSNEFGKAQESLEMAFQLDPTDPIISAELGSAYYALAEYEAAENAYRQAAALAPDEPAFWLLLAQFSLVTEIEIDSLALPASRNALALQPDDPASYDALGFSHFLLNNTVMAERMFQRALALDGSFASAHYHLGLLYLAEGQNDPAIHYLEQAMASDPEGPIAPLAERTLDRITD